MKRQDIFDKVYKHLLNQGTKSIDDDGKCLYRDEDGMRCAIGCLIDDKNYNINIENKNIYSTLVKNAIKKSNKGIRLNIKTVSMLGMLQDIHDEDNPENWAGLLRSLAKTCRLKIPA